MCVNHLFFWNAFLTQPFGFTPLFLVTPVFPLQLHPSTQPSNVGLPIAWGVDNLFVSPSMFFWGNPTHMHSFHHPYTVITPIFISLAQNYSLRFISLFSTFYPISPFENLKFNISKVSTFKLSIYKNQGIDLSLKIWFYFCFPHLTEPYSTKSSIWKFLTQHSYPAHHKVPLI